MANNLLSEVFGIDQVIQDIQIELYSKLGTIWSGEIEGYGRVYKNPVNNGTETPEYYRTSKTIIPEWFNALKQDYESVYFDDNKACVFCFLINEQDNTSDEYVFENNIKVVFMADLDKIYPNKIQRLDAKMQQEAIQALREISYNRYKLGGIERRIETIFIEYSSKDIEFDNMDKRVVFAVKLKLNYYINDKCE